MMRRPQFRCGLLVATAIALAGCAESRLAGYAAKEVVRDTPSAPRPTTQGRAGGIYKVGNPYQVAGVWYYPKEDPTYDETGIASWYGPGFHEKATANGEIFDQNEITAAHKTLPLPSLVRVTNLENGRSIIVRVNDRGPFVNGRIIDLSRKSAQLLGIDRAGTAKVRVQMVGPASGDVNVAQPRPQLSPEDKPPVVAAPRPTVVAEALPPPPGARGQTTVVAKPAPPPPPASTVMAAANETPNLESQPVRQVPVMSTGIYVQAGAFTQFDNANRLGARLTSLGPTRISSAMVGGTEFFRVRVGPLSSVEQADQTLNYLIANGNGEARIVVE